MDAGEVIAAYRLDPSIIRTAKRFRCRTTLISEILAAAGEQLSPGGKRKLTCEQEASVVAKYCDGLSLRQLGAAFGVSVPTVRGALARASVTLRSPGRAANPDRPARVRAPKPSMMDHGNWKGGRVRTAQGYIRVTPMGEDLRYCAVGSTGYVPEHRLVVGRFLGRPLRADETVHHINGDRSDNRLENLQIRQGNHGNGVALRCNDCGSSNVAATRLAPE